MRDLSCTVYMPKLTVWNGMLYIKTEEGEKIGNMGTTVCVYVCMYVRLRAQARY